MIKGSKICGIKDPDTLNFIINYPYPPNFIGFICNYPKSSRYVSINDLKNLLKVKKNKIKVFGPNKIASQLEGSKIFTKS